MIKIGFSLADGRDVFQEDRQENHEDIAMRIIRQEGWEEYFKQSEYRDPSDFLVFSCGALKIGNSYYGKVIQFHPPKITPSIQQKIAFYKAEGYKIDLAPNYQIQERDLVRLFHE